MTLNSQDRGYADAVRVDHNNCRLGKWYDSAGRELFGNLPAYKALVQPHARVHASVHAMLPYLDRGWEKNLGMQQEMYEKMRETEEASKEVMSVIDQMVREKHGD
ncbi:MAG: CZB domain-containing protein [Thiobacillaceae bacterium]|nr:CZB domain-containing protein [Thiobacillaceae bacterium]